MAYHRKKKKKTSRRKKAPKGYHYMPNGRLMKATKSVSEKSEEVRGKP